MKVREVAFAELKQDRSPTACLYDERLADKWDKYVRNANNGTLFHTRRFLSYHPPHKFTDHSLLFERDQKWLALLSAALTTVDGTKQLISHGGASFGGPVTRSDLSIKDAFRVVEALLAHCQKSSVKRIVMTLPPQFYYWRPSNYLDFALLDFGFTYSKREVASVIPLDFADEDTLLIFNPESRRAVRKAQKMAVDVRECEDFALFYSILKKNLKLRHNVQPTHSLEELLKLHRLFPDKIRLFGAYVEKRMVAGIVIFEVNSRVVLAFYISHDESMQQYRGVNLLFYHVVRWAIHRQFRFLDFGIFTVNMLPNWGLARFKESFGAQGVFRDTLVKQL